MTRPPAFLAGRLATAAGDGLAGARLRVVAKATKGQKKRTVLVDGALSGDDGSFRIAVPSDLLGGERTVSVEAVDSRGRKVASADATGVKPSATRVVGLKVSDTVARRFKPHAPMLERLRGPLLDPDGPAMIAQAIGIVAPAGTPQHNRFLNAMMCPLPPIDVLETLVDDAWGVLDADPVAVQHFRSQLRLIAPAGEPRRESFALSSDVPCGPFGGMDDAIAFGAEPGPALMAAVFPNAGGSNAMGPRAMSTLTDGGLPFGAPICGVPRDRYLPVAAAAVMSARSLGEAALQLGAIEHGLCGLSRYHTLLEAAHGTLAGGGGERFRGLMGFFAGECGPDDGPLPPWPFPPDPECPDLPGIPDVDPCFDERWACLRDLIDALGSHLRPFGRTRYEITSVTPDSACGGDQIVIRGTDFGDAGGQVCFSRSPLRLRCVDVVSWSDTEIVVVVPDGVGDADVSLKIVEDIVHVCGSGLTIYRQGNSLPFSGGGVSVLGIWVDNLSSNVCVEPDEEIDIRWSALGGNSVRVRVHRGSSVLLDQSGLPSVGTLGFVTPAVTTEATLRVEVTATGACGTDQRTLDMFVTVVPILTIEGMEVTQAIQQFWRPGSIPNSVPTISGKDTIVRVYVSSDRNGFLNDRIGNVTGTLTVDGTVLTPINGITPTNPGGGNPFIIARRRADIDRTVTNHTLNFRIPAGLCTGTQTLRARVGVDICGGTTVATRNQSHSWQNNTALRVRFVRVRDNRPGGSGTRPSTADCQYTVQRAFDLFPSPPTDIGPAWRATWTTTRDITSDDGLRGLLNDLDDEHNCSAWEWMWAWTGATECPDADNAEWVGLTDSRQRGWATGGNTCVSAEYVEANGQGDLMRIKTAHEVGHNLGRCHDNQGCGTSTPGGSCTTLGALPDVGFDPYWNQTVVDSTNQVFDIMSYACTRWIDEATWRNLIDAI